MRILLKKTLWFLPFACFIAGYWLPYLFFSVNVTTVPNLLGKNVQTALQLASECNLSIKLLREQEDATLPTGTVLFQTPNAQRSIRPHQTILLVTSYQPPQQATPNCIGSTVEAVSISLKKQGLPYAIVYVPSDKPSSTIIAQEPSAGMPFNQTKLTLYAGTNHQEKAIVSSCIGLTVQDAYDFFTLHALPIQTEHECGQEYSRCRCIITEQKPLPGSCIDLKKPSPIYLKAKR